MERVAFDFARMVGKLIFDRRGRAPAVSVPKHVAVIRWDGKYGDAFVSSFFYRELRKLKGCMVTVIAPAPLAELHEKYFNVDHVLTSSPNPSLAELLRLRRKLRRIDTVVHLVGRVPVREMAFMWLLRPQNVFSLDDELNWVNGKLGAATAGLSFSRKYASVVEYLGIGEVDRTPIIPVLDAQATGTRFDVVVNPFGSRPDKSMKAPRVVQVLRSIADWGPHMRVGVLSSPSTSQQAEVIARAAERTNVEVIQRVNTILDAIGIIAAAGVVVSVDTAVVHIASGLRKRLVAIYPSQGHEVNPWLPEPSPTTRVLFTQVPPGLTGKNMDAFKDNELMDALSAVVEQSSMDVEDTEYVEG